ncbi:hypothetical protein B0H14DRAFT_2777695 [Mycena olivaceomarginata]|nr:hypothetical protein B0H14DRAFT_2777695 [Mycena olivaceomarginata]
MVFFLAAALAASIWTLSAAAFPSQGSVVWSAPAPPAVVAECYPLSIQFTSSIAPRNISFFYYVGSQSYAGQTIVPITTWPQSQWVDVTTVFTAFSPSVPVAAGTMIALRVMAYDDSPSYLLQIVIQPNTDTSCITSAYQRGTADYNRYPRQPATTTVSPTTLASPAGTPTHSSTVVAGPETSWVYGEYSAHHRARFALLGRKGLRRQRLRKCANFSHYPRRQHPPNCRLQLQLHLQLQP